MGQAASYEEPRPQLTEAEVQNLPLVSHYVYALLSEHVYNEPHRRPLPPDWKVLMECNEVHLDKEGYYATAYVNHRTHSCVIAERGTHDALGIRAGVWMYFDEPTIQFALAEQFSKLVRMRLQMMDVPPPPSNKKNDADASEKTNFSEPVTYTISYTGHSLGGVIAACRACAEHSFAVTFESPGCRAFVEKTMHPFKADDIDVVTYLRQPNPINTLRPHCGYLVQLPYPKEEPASSQQEGPSKAATSTPSQPTPTGDGKTTPAPQPIKKSFGMPTFTMPTPQDYLRSKLLERTVPELQVYLTQIEPILRELLDQTTMVHSIEGIVKSMEAAEHSNQGQDVILKWPSHIMQFIEYFNTQRALDDPANQEPHVYAAYEALMNRLYQTEGRPIQKIPLRFLREDATKLLRIWIMVGGTPAPSTPLRFGEKSLFLTLTDIKVLNSASIQADVLSAKVLTAFQLKQYLTRLCMKEHVKSFLDQVPVPTAFVSRL